VKRSRLQSAAGAHAPHLAGDGASPTAPSTPTPFEELLAAEVVAGDALRVQLALDDDLGGDARVVGADLPQRVRQPRMRW
jgi:hypothetical protein